MIFFFETSQPSKTNEQMGLFETFQRKSLELGLGPRLIKLLPYLMCVTTLASVVLIAILPMEGQFRRTYISENALMPSQAYSYFRESEWNILRGYRTQVEHIVENKWNSTQRNEQLQSWLHEFGVTTDICHNDVAGDTLYGVWHAPHGDGTEAMVLCVPWVTADEELNIGGTALGLSLARYFSRWPIWSKNIIVVFTENTHESLRSWVEAYHTSLDLTGGSIEAAVVLDYAGSNDAFEYTEVFYEGLNGELPNLDLVNIAVSIIEHEQVKVALHGLPIEFMSQNNFWTRLKIMFLGIKNSALSGMDKIHGNEAFSGWRIQAVTIKAVGKEGRADITTFGRIPEAMFRSINNLLEKFHQSFFFYLLLAPRNFVSISSYLPSAVLLSVTFAIASLSCILNNKFSQNWLLTESITAVFIWLSSLICSFIMSQVFIKCNGHLGNVILLLINILLSILPLLYKVNNSKWKETFTYRLRSIGFLYFSLVLTSLLMLNFPLAFLIGLLSLPLILIRTTTHTDTDRDKTKLRNVAILFITNPFISMTLFVMLFSNINFNILQAMTQAYLKLNVWTWLVFCIGWYPVWLITMLSSLEAAPAEPVGEFEKKLQ